MTTTSWTGTNGNWTQSTWTDGVPNATLDAIIDGTSSSPDTVTFNSAQGAAHSLSMAFATLAMAGGALTLENSSSLSGLNQTGGLLDFAAGGYVGANLTQSAGTIEVASGTLFAEGTADSLAGTVSGGGFFELYTSGTATLHSGLKLTVANFTIGDGSALVGGNIAYGGGFTLASPGTLLLNGHTFTASGTSQLNGLVDGPGTLLVSGTADANGLFTHGDPTISDTGLITEDGNVYLAYASGTDLARLAIAAGGTWDMLANVEIAESGTATISNAGLFEKTGGTGDGYVVANFNNTGIVSVTSGTLVLEGTASSLGGTVNGSGEFELYSNGTATLHSGLKLGVANFTIGDGSALLGGNLSYTGGFTLASPGTLLLSGDTFTASGASQLNGLVDGAGTLHVSGTADANGLFTHGDPTISDTGVITEDGNVYLAYASGTDLATLAIAAGGTWDMLANVEIAESGTATINNAGLFEKTGGTGAGYVVANFNNTGIISVTSGTLVLEGAASGLGGTVNGSGEIELYSNGTATLQSGLKLGIANFTIGDGSVLLGGNLAYAGGFTLASPGTLLLSGDTFTASRTAQLSGLVDGLGTLVVSGTADANGLFTHGDPTISDTGLITEDGNVYLAYASGTDLATLAIAAGGTWDMLANVEIAEAGTATVSNAGLFEKTGGTGDGYVLANFVNTDVLSVTAGTLVLEGAASSLGGTVSGSGELELYSNGTATLRSGLKLGVANFTIGDGSALLGGNLSYAGGFTLASPGTLLLNGGNFTASGISQLNGLVDGLGTLHVGGTADANGLATHGDPTISDSGLITEDGNVYLAYASGTDLASLAIASGGIWDMLANVEIVESGTATITNAGLFEKTGGAGDGYVIADFVNTGTLSVTSGTLIFDGASFSNSGIVDAAGGGITFDPAVNNTNLSAGTLTGGRWEAQGGTLAITGGAITTDAATIILAGAGSEMEAGNGSSFTPIEQSLTAITAHGALEILRGATYDTANAVADSGLIELSGATFADSRALIIGAGGTLSGSGRLSAAAIKNSGTIVAAAGGRLVVAAPISGSGTLVADGTLDLTGTGNVITGNVLGSGVVEVGGGSTTLDLSAGSNVHEIEVIAGAKLVMGSGAQYNGAFIDGATGGTSVLDLTGHIDGFAHASFTGSSGGVALINGGGTLSNTGTMTLSGAALDGGTRLANSKLTNQSGLLALGDSTGSTASIVNGATGTYDMIGAVSLSAASKTADTVRNAGVFEKTGAGTAVIGAAFTNTGTIEVTSGTLEITAPFTNTGTIIGTEIQSGGTTFITAPSPALFHQYAAAMEPSAGSAALVAPASLAEATMKLAVPQSG